MTPFLGQVQNLLETTPPAEEPLTLDQAKNHLRVDSDMTDDDLLIGALISAARERCEAETKRAFVARSYLLRLNGFPFASGFGVAQALNAERLPNLAFGEIRLPKPPLLSVESITYVDANGLTQTLDPSAYLVYPGGKLQGIVTPAYGTTWPAARYQLASVEIAYTAGYGAASDLPASVAPAMLLMLGNWYRNRESVTPSAMAELPMGVSALLASLQWGSYG